MSNARKLRRVKRQTYWLLNFWNGLPAWAIEQAEPCECGQPHEPSGTASQIGAAIVPARSLSHAIDQAWSLGCNPGGDVAGGELSLGAADLEAVGVPIGELITDTEDLDARLSHATMHLS